MEDSRPMVLLSHRDQSVDQLRGIAIAMMVIANMAPIYGGQIYFIYRFISSLAAPLFVILAGMMVARGCVAKKGSFEKSLKKGAHLIFCGVVVDTLFFDTFPLTTMEVLYLIGVALPLAYLYFFVAFRFQLALLIATLTFGVLLREWFSYPDEVSGLTTVTHSPFPFASYSHWGSVFRNWLFSGVFPLFPWASLVFYGVLMGRMRWEYPWKVGSLGWNQLFGCLFTVGGALLWIAFPGEQKMREGDLELFYPMPIGECLFSWGSAHLGLLLLDRLEGVGVTFPGLLLLGRYSLICYLAHLAIIYPLLDTYFHLVVGVSGLLVGYIFLLLGLLVLCYGLENFKSYRRQREQPSA